MRERGRLACSGRRPAEHSLRCTGFSGRRDAGRSSRDGRAPHTTTDGSWEASTAFLVRIDTMNQCIGRARLSQRADVTALQTSSAKSAAWVRCTVSRLARDGEPYLLVHGWPPVYFHTHRGHEPSVGRARLSQRAATMRNQDVGLRQTRPTARFMESLPNLQLPIGTMNTVATERMCPTCVFPDRAAGRVGHRRSNGSCKTGTRFRK